MQKEKKQEITRGAVVEEVGEAEEVGGRRGRWRAGGGGVGRGWHMRQQEDKSRQWM